ncbi:MAG: hypothetical protein R6W76_09035 [Caldilinea sp.]
MTEQQIENPVILPLRSEVQREDAMIRMITEQQDIVRHGKILSGVPLAQGNRTPVCAMVELWRP